MRYFKNEVDKSFTATTVPDFPASNSESTTPDSFGSLPSDFGIGSPCGSYSGKSVPFANIFIEKLKTGTTADENENYMIREIPGGKFEVCATFIGYEKTTQSINIISNKTATANFELAENASSFNALVVKGTQKESTKLESAIPVEIYNPGYFKKNPTPNMFEALQIVNGVQPQVNCNLCSTGYIHINGMEGPYTMNLIDGMPIVSSLSTVYGLSGIPNSMIKRIEIVKGPTST